MNIYSEKCGTSNIEDNEMSENIESMENASSLNLDEIDVDSVNSELQDIVDTSDDSRPNSRQNSRPNSRANSSLDLDVSYF